MTKRIRTDIADFVSGDAVEDAAPPQRKGVQYRAFVDPSGGTLAIAHADGEKLIVDVVREVHPPFSPDAVCREFAALLKDYKISTITGDRYAGEWPRERFRARR